MQKFLVLSALLACAFSQTIGPGVPDSRCPPGTPSPPVHFPDPSDCQVFHTCIGGSAFPQRCPPGQEWSVANNWCDWPDRAGCTGASETCPPTNDITVHLPHPTDCSRFFTCSWGTPHERECPPGQHWDTRNNWCDWPDRAGCDPNQTTPWPAPPTAPPTNGPRDTTTRRPRNSSSDSSDSSSSSS